MAYETPKNAARETFIEPVSPRAIHSGGAPPSWTAINAPINCERGGLLLSGVTGSIEISIDGSTTLCTIQSDVYLPLSFPVYIKGSGRGAACSISLINYTLGGATVRG